MKTSLLPLLALSLVAVPTLPLGAQEDAPPEDTRPAKPEFHELLTHDVISFAREIYAVVETDAPTDEKVATLQAMKPRAAELGAFLRVLPKEQLQQAFRELTHPEDVERRNKTRERLNSTPELATAYGELVETLRTGVAVEPTAEAKQVAEAMLALMHDIISHVFVDNGGVDHRAALEALRPRARELGESVKKAGVANVRRATELLRAERGGMPEFEGLNSIDGELGDLCEELAMLMRGEPAWIALDAPAEQVAADFLATLREGITRMKAADGTQPLLDVIEEMQPRIFVFMNWAEASKQGKEVAAILDKSPEFAELAKQHEFLHGIHGMGDNPGISAQLYMQLIGMVVDWFHAEAGAEE